MDGRHMMIVDQICGPDPTMAVRDMVQEAFLCGRGSRLSEIQTHQSHIERLQAEIEQLRDKHELHEIGLRNRDAELIRLTRERDEYRQMAITAQRKLEQLL